MENLFLYEHKKSATFAGGNSMGGQKAGLKKAIIMKSTLLAVGLTGILAASPAFGAEQIDFDITDGKVVPSESYAAMVSVLGAAMSTGSADMPVTVQINLGGTMIEPYGGFADADTGNVNDGGDARHHIHLEQLDADTPITITGQSWWPRSSGATRYLQADSHDESVQVKVLRNGDAAPALSGWNGQSAVDFYIRAYLEGGTVNIDDNQVIYLFELGTTNLNSRYADFQDLVVLVTLGESVEALQDKLEPLYD